MSNEWITNERQVIDYYHTYATGCSQLNRVCYICLGLELGPYTEVRKAVTSVAKFGLGNNLTGPYKGNNFAQI